VHVDGPLRVAVCCVCCSVLQCVAVCCSVLQSVAGMMPFLLSMCTSMLLCVLRCAAVFCSVVRCVAVRLQRAAVCCSHMGFLALFNAHGDGPLRTHQNTLQHTATHCNVLQHAAAVCSSCVYIFILHRDWETQSSFRGGAVCCSVMQYVAVCSSILQCDAVRCSMLHCVTVCCSCVCHLMHGPWHSK